MTEARTVEFRDDIPYMPEGVDLDQTWFCGGRVGAAIGLHGGLTQITYYGRQPMGRAEFFKAEAVAAWTKLFRPCVVIDGVPYHPTFKRTSLFPFGYRSTCAVGGVTFEHELVLLNDAVVQRIRLLKNPRRATVTLRLVFHGGPARSNRDGRTWTDFVSLKGAQALVCSAVDQVIPPKLTAAQKALTQQNSFDTQDVERGETFIAVGADQPSVFATLHHGFKYHLDTAPIRKEASLFVAFAWERGALKRRVNGLRKTVAAECDAKFAAATGRYPTAQLPNKALQSFFAQVPAVVEALRVSDIPGGMRASAGHYWIWGWDSMVYSKGLMLAGHGPFVEQMLAFYRGLADPKLGIPHAIDTTLTPLQSMAFAAQSLYAVMLYNHFCATRDFVTLRRYFPFARWIVEQAMAREVRGTGLIDGPSLFPDFPELLGHDGHDLSVFNNSIFYQALRATRDLAATLAAADGGGELPVFVGRLDAAAERCRENFSRIFFDREAGYFIDSASSIDFARRAWHPSYAILWVTSYAADLVRAELPRIASFMAAHFPHSRGIFHFPPEERGAFLSDGNQCSAFYPVIEPFYRNVMSLAGRKREIENWPEVVAWYWRRNTIPEGLTFDAMNAGDLTPDCPGGKQPFAGKSWYELFFTAYAGIDVGIGGLSVRPTPVSAPIVLRNLCLGKRRLDVRIGGVGRDVRVTLNGRMVPDPARIPLSALGRGRNRLSIVRTTGA